MPANFAEHDGLVSDLVPAGMNVMRMTRARDDVYDRALAVARGRAGPSSPDALLS